MRANVSRSPRTPDTARLDVRITDYNYRPVLDARVTLRADDTELILSRIDDKGGYVLEGIAPGHYHLQVEAKGLADDDREVHLKAGENREIFILGREDMPYYYRGKIRVPFEPMEEFLAVVMPDPEGAEQAKSQRSEVSKLAADRGLRLEPVGENIVQSGIHILRLPEGSDAKQREDAAAGLRDTPGILHVGPLLKFFEENVTILTGELIVRFRSDTTEGEIEKIAARHGLHILGRFKPLGPVYRLGSRDAPSYRLLETCARLAEEDAVEYAEPNLIHTAEEDVVTPADFLFPEQWDHRLIGTPQAWQILRSVNEDHTFGNPDVLMAIVDSGVDAGHPEFAGTLSDGAPKIHCLFDFTLMVANNDTRSSNHGTCCASAATARADNPSTVEGFDEGVAGVAGNCRLMGIRRGGNTEARYADMYLWTAGFDPGSDLEGFPAPLDRGADIISSSFGFSAGSPISGLMRDTFDILTDQGRGGRGVLLFFSAGNAGADLDLGFHRPWGMYERCFSIAASTLDDDGISEVRSNYSNFGSDIELCAPSHDQYVGGRPLHAAPDHYAAFTATERGDAGAIHATVGRPTRTTALRSPVTAGTQTLPVSSVIGLPVGGALLIGDPGSAGCEGHEMIEVNSLLRQVTIARATRNEHPSGRRVYASTRDYRSNFGGTSHSTPLVAGVAALLLSMAPGMGWRDVRDTLRATASKVDPHNAHPTGRWRDREGRISTDPGYTGPFFSEFYGFGRVDAAETLRSVLSGCAGVLGEIIDRIFRRG